MSTLSYLRNLILDPSIASITPSSRFAVKRVCRSMNFSRARVVVEYGPGLGVFSRYLLSNMKQDARLILFETNVSFYKELRVKLADPRVHLINGSCEMVEDVLMQTGGELADYIISGIPFSMLEPDLRNRIIVNTANALKNDGSFLTYQFCPPTAGMDPFLRKPLEPYFDLVRIEYELLNVPPLRIYESKKKVN